jgi:hypothetical protein
MNLEDIILGVTSQAQKYKYHMISLACGIGKHGKLTEIESRMVVTRGWGGGNRERGDVDR